MRVLVCGGRDFKDEAFVERILSDRLYPYLFSNKQVTIIEGGARGVDTFALNWVLARVHSDYPPRVEEYPADWEKYGWAAGPIRNIQMLDEGKPDLVIAFPGGRGTKNMVNQARDRGVPVEIVSYP